MQRRLSQQERAILQRLIDSDIVDWAERNFWVPDPRDPITGELLRPGPIQLSELQKKILRAALTLTNDEFPYTTVVYSAPKKSGKTRIGALVAAWFAATQDPFNEIYCIANDGKQSTDRILSAVRQCADLNRALGWGITKSRVTLPNGTFIEAIPCDPSGQAGSNPGLTVWSEMWGFRYQHKERLWTEMTIPPTRYGKALRWVESYAGYTNESTVLENLYNLGVHEGKRHPLFADTDVPVNVHEAAGMFCYWDEVPRMPWQTEEYYAQEQQILTPSEFLRIHRNQWISSVEKAFDITWWDACQGGVPPLDTQTPIVLGLDASVSRDCCAGVAVSRHPKRTDDVAIRNTRVWAPPAGGKIDLTETLEKYVRDMCNRFHVVAIAYDEYQLHKLATDLRKEGIARFIAFGQNAPRAVADNQFLQMVMHKRIVHDGNRTLREHVDNAEAKHTGEGERIRFVRPDRHQSQGRTASPIDALVAASMATHECLRLALG